MTRFVLAQLANRWPQAVLLMVLSAAATAAAVSIPVYGAAADREVIAAQLAAAERTELFVSSGPHRREWSATGQADPTWSLLAELDGFETTVRVEIPVSGLDHGDDVDRLVAWQDFCPRVVVHEGRCPVANRELAITPARAVALAVGPGDRVVLTPLAAWAAGPSAGPPAEFTVVGIVEAADPEHPSWGPDPVSAVDAAYTTPNSIARLEHAEQVRTVTAVLADGYLTAQRVPSVRADLARAQQEAARRGDTLRSDIPQLLDRVSESGAQAWRLLPVAGVPLVALCWFVLHVAAAHAIAGRRVEYGAVAVRGAPWPVRAALAGGEVAIPVLVGAPLGFVAGHAMVAAATGGWVPAAGGQWSAAGLAVVGSLLAVSLGVRRELSVPIAGLLRSVPPRRRRWVLATVEVVVLSLAAAAVVQLRAFDADLTGLPALAPALVILVVAVLVARVVWPAAHLLGRVALRRGRLDRAMAAIQLARRPATARLAVVVAVVLGMLGFATVSADIADQQRAGHAERVTGAARVLEVAEVDRTRLLEGVRTADPEGRYAMAVIAAAGGPAESPRLAVDATRLARVAGWRAEYGSADPAQVADLLRPPAAEPLMLRDGPVAVDVSVPEQAPAGSTVLSMTLVSDSGERPVVRFGPLAHGRAPQHAQVSGCPDGCRLAYLSVSVTGDSRAVVSWHDITQDGRSLVPAGWRTGQWRQVTGHEAGRLAIDHDAGGVTLRVDQARRGINYRVMPPDAPHPLPVIVAGPPPVDGYLTNVDNQPVAATPVAYLTGLPRFGDTGVLLDLQYAEHSATAPGTVGSQEVWLAADAPADLVDRLAAAGLVVTGERSVPQMYALLDGSGSAVAVRYHLLAAGVAALVALVALAQVAIADRRMWTGSLRRLRVQGLPRRTATATLLWSYGGLVAVGTVIGLLAAAAGWWATGDRLPLAVDPLSSVWPQPTPVLAPWLAVVAALFAGGAAAAWWSQAAVRREVVR